MPTRILSFAQLVLEADPGFRRASNQPWGYEFSNGRRFYDPVPLYGSAFMQDDSGIQMRDDSGTPMQSDGGAATTPETPTTGFPFGEGTFGENTF